MVVLSYPLIFDTSTVICEMSLAKRRSINSGAVALDEMIKSRAEAAGFVYSEVRDEFTGHGACSSRPYLNGLTVIPPQNSYHPNTNGYAYGYLPAFSGSAS